MDGWGLGACIFSPELDACRRVPFSLVLRDLAAMSHVLYAWTAQAFVPAAAGCG